MDSFLDKGKLLKVYILAKVLNYLTQSRMNSSIYSTTIRSINDKWSFFKEKINSIEPPKQKVKISTLLTVLGATFPLNAFLYWRLLFEEFNSNYFSRCFSLEDIPYILYLKGTYAWFILLLYALPSALIFFPIAKIYKINLILILLISIACGVVEIGGFGVVQVIIYTLLVVITTILIQYYNRNALFAFAILVGWFFALSGMADAKIAKTKQIKFDIRSNSGQEILSEKDSTKYFVGSTSKYYLLYDLNQHKLLKFQRDTINY